MMNGNENEVYCRFPKPNTTRKRGRSNLVNNTQRAGVCTTYLSGDQSIQISFYLKLPFSHEAVKDFLAIGTTKPNGFYYSSAGGRKICRDMNEMENKCYTNQRDTCKEYMRRENITYGEIEQLFLILDNYISC